MDTLVRVNLEKNNGGRKMIMMVMHDFTPCTDDELGVKRGDRVRVLYKEFEWAYAIRDDGAEGFLPFSYLASPAQLSKRHARMDKSEERPDLTERMSSLTLASTKAVQFSSNVSSTDSASLSDNTQSSTDSDSTTSSRQPRYRPARDNIARLGGYVGSTTKLHRDARKRQASPKVQIPDATPGNGTSSGVYTDSDSPAVRSDASPQADTSPLGATRRQVEPKRITFKQVASDSDSGCEQTTEDPQQRQAETKTNVAAPELSTSIETFEKRPLGNYIVLFAFDAAQENDLPVRPGEFVTCLNKDDPDWYWVVTRDQDEGFVPSNYLCDVKGPELQQDLDSYNGMYRLLFISKYNVIEKLVTFWKEKSKRHFKKCLQKCLQCDEPCAKMNRRTFHFQELSPLS